MSNVLNIAIAGLGTVGVGTIKILQENAGLVAERAGKVINIVAVSARSKKDRGIKLDGIQWVDDATKLADIPNLDVIVEVIGGSEGVAKALVEKALGKGISVVTANKALIAHHGVALAELAEKHNATLAFEAAVAGGIPIIKALRDGLAANQFSRVAGILNGTCNYILTRMEREKLDFATILADAQKLGYAEADPSFDVDGVDTAHKTAILASLAFGAAPAIDKVYIEGIRNITPKDMEFAAELGLRIKLLGLASRTPRGVEQRVHPCLVPLKSPLANVHDVFNAVVVEGDAVGRVFLEGRGAGAGPTGSSVVADIMDIARGVNYKPFTLPAAKLAKNNHAKMDDVECGFYLRLSVKDEPGVLADLTRLLKEDGISMHSFLQHPQDAGEAVHIVLTTHKTTEANMKRAVAKITKLSTVSQAPILIRIESL